MASQSGWSISREEVETASGTYRTVSAHTQMASQSGWSISREEACELQIARALERFFGRWVKLLESYDSQGSCELEISSEDFGTSEA